MNEDKPEYRVSRDDLLRGLSLAMPPPVDLRSLLSDVYDRDTIVLTSLRPVLDKGLSALTKDIVSTCLCALTQENLNFRIYATPRFLEILLESPLQDPSGDIMAMYEYGNAERQSAVTRESQYRSLYNEQLRYLIADVLEYCYTLANSSLMLEPESFLLDEERTRQTNTLMFWRKGYPIS